MKIAVLSDTHIPVTASDLPKQVYDGIKGVDLILHAGDLVELDLLKRLSRIAPVKAVCGNMDSANTCSQLPKKEVIRVESVALGLIHGWGHPSNLPDVLKGEFSGVDAIIFGHSHNAMNEKRDGILFFNPGSPTDKVFAPFNSYGILEVNGTVIKAKIVKI